MYHRLHDPADFAGKRTMVVGSGDAAVETAIALAAAGARVTLSCRSEEITRPKPANLEMLERLLRDPMADVAIEHPTSERVTAAAGSFAAKPHPPGSVELRLGTRVREIREREVELVGAGGRPETIENDVVFAMIGRGSRSALPALGAQDRGRDDPAALDCAGPFHGVLRVALQLEVGRLDERPVVPERLVPDQPARPARRRRRHGRGGGGDPRTLIGTLAISARRGPRSGTRWPTRWWS